MHMKNLSGGIKITTNVDALQTHCHDNILEKTQEVTAVGKLNIHTVQN